MKYYIRRTASGHIQVEEKAMHEAKKRRDPKRYEGAGWTSIEAEDFPEAREKAEGLLPPPGAEEPRPRAPEAAPLDPEAGRFFLMRADTEHHPVDWIAEYRGNGEYRETREPFRDFVCMKPSRLYEVRKVTVWEKVL